MTSPPQCFCQQTTEGLLEEGTRVLNGVWSVLLMPSGKIKKEPARNLVEWGSLVYLEKANGVLCLEMPHHSCSCWHGGELHVEKPRGWCHRVRKWPSAPLCLPHTYTLIPYLWTSCLLWWGRDSCSFLFFSAPGSLCDWECSLGGHIKHNQDLAGTFTYMPIVCFQSKQICYVYIWLYSNCTDSTYTCSVI